MLKIYLGGFVGDAATSKVLMTAAEKGIDIEVIQVDILKKENQQTEYRKIVPFGSIPYLRDGDLVLYEPLGIMSYLDDKGFGDLLKPQNGLLLARQYQWISIADRYLSHHVDGITMETIFKPIMQMGYRADARVVVQKRQAIAPVLDAFDKQLQGQYVVGRFSLADLYWAPYIHALYTTKQGDLVESRPNIKSWWENMRARESSRVLPSLGDIRARRARGYSFKHGEGV